jgi:polyhydroxyalkanoate synthesis regulator phasin
MNTENKKRRISLMIDEDDMINKHDLEEYQIQVTQLKEKRYDLQS